MLLKLKANYASPLRCLSQGDIFDFDAKESKALLDEKYATIPTKAELEAWRAKQK